MKIFKCTECGKELNGFIPLKCECGFSVTVINGVYQFTNDSPISIEGDGLKWLGYENVGENYEPGYVFNKDDDNVGSSKELAEFMGNDKIILDLGAGLGGSSISFALAGLRAIGADISQAMLEAAIKRAQKHNVPDDKIIFVRMNGYKLELADNSVDVVIAIDVLHQVDRPELVMEEIKRVLKPDGFFLQYGGGKNLGYTEEQQTANTRYNEAQKDIQSFYDKIIIETGYGELPFSSWDKAADSIKENFVEFITIEDTGMYGANNMEWPLKLGLHKIKTRASGSKQLIPDEIHNEAWARTDEYAKSKYGENYDGMTRYLNFTSGMILYKLRVE
jgi:ubiquinone/menaquinone biosynthesis C-methylase UbiE